jgi:hypothetical protein
MSLMHLSNSTCAKALRWFLLIPTLLAAAQGAPVLARPRAAPAPSITIGNASVTESNAGTVNAVFNVALSNASNKTVTVAYVTQNGTATAGSDYVALSSATLTFPSGTTTRTISVPINGDTRNEDNETFFVNLSNPSNASIADAQGQGTILNDDPLPAISIGNASVAEGNAGTTNATFTVSLSAASGKSVSVSYQTANGTATAGSDYVAKGLTALTFAPGTTAQNITVAVNGDALNESNETFFVNLSGPSNATIADAQGQGTIVDDDTQPVLTIGDVSVTEGNSGSASATFVATLSAPSAQTVSVGYQTANGTATSGSDYTSVGLTTLTFAPGVTSRSIVVAVNGDTLNEGDETFFVNLSGATNAAIADAQGQGTIVDDDPLPTITINDVTVNEGNTGTANARFTVSLSAASARTITVAYQTADTTATAGVDYVAQAGLLAFSPGATTRTITVLVNGDTVDEDNETFAVNLSNATNAAIFDAQGVGTITDNDAAPALVIGDITVGEGNSGATNAVFTVSLSAVSGKTVSVGYTTAGGSATAGIDYIAPPPATLTFPPGTTTQNITVAINGDTLLEGNETFFVNLSAPINAMLGDAQAIGTIVDDEITPTITIGDASVPEGNTGTVAATFLVSLSAASSQPVTVNYQTVDGSAAAGADYLASVGTLTFAPGSTTQNLVVQVRGDLLAEGDETFYVSLSGPNGALLADSQGLGTILDNDPLPTLSVGNTTVTEGQSGTTSAAFAVTLSGASGRPVTVSYQTSDGTATAPADYATQIGGLTFLPGTTVQTVTVTVNADTLVEPAETFFVNLLDPTNALLADSQGAGTIVDGTNATGALSIGDTTVVEGNDGTASATFAVTLSGNSSQTATVSYGTVSGSATADDDYVAHAGTLSFPPGTTTQNVTVLVKGDLLDEDDETFSVVLSSPVNATIADAQGQGTVTDDDLPPTIAVGDITAGDGQTSVVSATFTVSLSAASGKSVSVGYHTADGTAKAGSDYVAREGPLTFPPGITKLSISVPVENDTLVEGNETFFVDLASPVNATIADGHGMGTIIDGPSPAPKRNTYVPIVRR